MCRMIGFSFSDNKYIDDLYNMLKDMAKNGIKKPHPHGFGIYAKNAEGEILYHKFEETIYNTNLQLPKLKIGIMHARKASPNSPISFLQLHPFIDEKGNVFCHNGTIFTADKNNLFKSDSYEYFQKIKNFKNNDELIWNLKNFVLNNKFTGANFLLIKEDKLYAFCYYNSEPEYYTMWYSENVVSSESLGYGFQKMNKGELLIFENGTLTFKELVI
ncbi:MAG: hypothetical protein H0Z24_04090 [Thermosipho sp. (in: Bacteria)]|nr:hypothetical protein [Thermosipho sp. (in: thermotogales)]